ncbi:MAG: Hsp20/alpha crystallin family protein [Candidatus Obscuribacterales bacterium]|nr:Hsp20/alpha crystallin family protein [Candidatus Obscuribacterales bacterium]
MLFQRLAGNDLFSSLREMQRLQDSLNRVLSSAPNHSAEYPLVNVWTSENGAIVRAEVPGIAPEDVDISLVHDTLTIRGSRKPEELKEGEARYRHERGFGGFTRSLQLPFGVEGDKVEAKFASGVLQITLPRAEAEKPRRISVVSES